MKTLMRTSGVKRNLLSDQVAEHLQDEILSGGLKPGDSLPSELELTEHFGVSRAVIREATRALAARGDRHLRSARGDLPPVDLPFLWMVAASLKTDIEIFGSVGLIPEEPQWENYVRAWTEVNISSYFWNTVIITAATVAIVVIFLLLQRYFISGIAGAVKG